MGTTLTAINGQSGVELRTVVTIEGMPYLLTESSTDANAVLDAYGSTDWSAADVLGGLSVTYETQSALSPWEPFDAPSSRVTLRVMDDSGNVGTDVLGALLFKREATTKTAIAADLSPTATTITVRRSDDLHGVAVHIGCEAITFAANNTGTDTLTGCTRGVYSPFLTEAAGNFGRTHYATPVTPGIDLESTPSTTLAEEPTDWKGRWIGVWLHRVVDGVLDAKAQAHRAFAGQITEIEDTESGEIVIHCIGVIDAIKEAVILRQQWTARLKEGVWVIRGTRFNARDMRDGVAKVPAALVVLPSGAATAYEMDEGFYSGSEIASRITTWLAQAKADGDLTFKLSFQYIDTTPAGTVRSSLKMSDPTAGLVDRYWRVSTHNFFVRGLLGWGSDGGVGGEISGSSTARTSTAYSDWEPLRTIPWADEAGSTVVLHVADVHGSFVDQSTLMPPAGTGYTGIVRVGGLYAACSTPSISGGEGTVTLGPALNVIMGADSLGTTQETIDRIRMSGEALVSREGAIPIEQVLCLESSFGVLVLSMLASTGGANWPAYELLPEQCSAAIPYDLLTDGLETEIAAAPWSADTMRVIVEKPTKLSEIWNVSFILRHVQLIWRQGRLALKGFATPTSAATLTLGTDDRAADVSVRDSQRASTKQGEEWLRNVIKIKTDAGPSGNDFASYIAIEIPGSVSNHGARVLTLEARNATKGAGSAAEDVRELMPTFVAPLAFLSYPVTLITVPIHFNLFEQATAGEVCLFSDDFARDPSTGTRGISAKPALVVASSVHGWGGKSGPATGEATLMLFPRLSLAPYSPCAEVSSYVAGTKVLTCVAHSHSEASAAVDASYFPAGSTVRVLQIDPAGAPLSWDDVVASKSGNDLTLTTGLGGYDATKLYRVYSDDYPDALTAQRANSYQADDADGLVADLRAPYGLTYASTGQTQTFTAAAATELAERIPTAAYGDGVALDTGHARAIARAINNGVSYLTAPQYPEIVTEAAYSGAGTWRLLYGAEVFVGVGPVSNSRTRKLYVGPTIKSTSGTASFRVTLARRMPASADPDSPSLDDITRQLPYTAHTFTTASATYVTAAVSGLNTSHLDLSEGILGGWAYLLVEGGTGASFRGFGAMYVGPMEAP